MTTPWFECGRNSVQTWDCDQMGHMNVQFYVQRAEDAVAHLAHHMGLGPTVAREANARLIPRQHHFRFHRELRPGAPYWLRAAPVYLPPNQIVITTEMLASAGDAVACAATGLYEWIDVSSRAVLDMPEDARAKAQALVQSMPPTALERGISINAPPRATATLAEAEQLGLIVAYRGEVSAEHCDPHGFLRVRDYMGRVSDAIPNLLLQTTGRDRSAETDARIGGAALEYRFVYRKPARAGDLISVRSGVKSIGAKTYNWVHWVLNEETGEALATAEAVAVAMDLAARKAIPIPETLRADLERLIVPGLSC
jgi:acyl-CoA thioester hydrolase